MHVDVRTYSPIEWAPTTAPNDAPPARSLLDVFASTVVKFADSIAIDAADAVLTYVELSEAVDRFAARLRADGIGSGDRVGIQMTSGRADLYIGILGVLASGAAYVPVDKDDPPARAAEIWRVAGACAIVEDGLTVTQLARPIGTVRDFSLDDDAWIILTSGSTGTPKAVAVTHRSAAAFVDAEAALFELSAEDRVLAGLSVGFDASCEEMWLAWRNGAALVPAPRSIVRTGVDLGPWLAEREVTVLSTVPTLASMFTDETLASVRLVILGGEACPQELGWRLARHCEVWNTYGPTEATVVSTAARISPGQPVTIGWPLAGWSVAVIDEAGDPVPFGEAGELVIGGVGLARYLDTALDAERFVANAALDWPRAYRSGDFVRETTDGLEFIGRRDDQVKLGGRRLELGEIAARLSAIDGVHSAAATVQKTAAGDKVLVGYITGGATPAVVRDEIAAGLPGGIVPAIVRLDGLPTKSSGKVDREALPWPPPPGSMGDEAGTAALSGTAAWLAELWTDQLGPLPMTSESDFFKLGGSSLQAAKLVSVLRAKYPTVAVADVYAYRRLNEFAARLDELGEATSETEFAPIARRRRWGAVQLAGMMTIISFVSTRLVIGVLAFNNIYPSAGLPHVGWAWLIASWMVLASPFGRASMVVVARNLLLPRLKAGRYPRRGWLSCRIWFVERLAEVLRLNGLAGTPWAARYARLSGIKVGPGARFGTLPPPTALINVGAGATIEADVDMHGWWIDGDEIVVGELNIGEGARVGAWSLLMPDVTIGDGAEVEPGSLIVEDVPAGEQWAEVPARRVGTAGESWPSEPAPKPSHTRFWRAMFAVGLSLKSLLPLIAAIPALLMLGAVGAGGQSVVSNLILYAPLVAAAFIVSEAVVIALAVRLVSPLIKPGWHADEGATGWALWFSENLMASARVVLFPLFASIYTRPWLRLAGMRIGRRSEISTAIGLNRCVTMGELSFAADEMVFGCARARGGWLHVAPITTGSRTFLGNGGIAKGNTQIGDGCLVGVLTTAPSECPDGTSWFGAPALELPRVPDCVESSRTVEPPLRLILGRGFMDLIRILLPGTVSVVLAALMYMTLDTVGRIAGAVAMVAAAPLVLFVAGLGAVGVTIALKWLLMGRYRPGDHPLWSFFVWRDEIVNSAQEQLAGDWLMNSALGTPLMAPYLRALGSKVGRDVWCETLTITEFDLVKLGDGSVVNRHACVSSHLYHDRLMRTGPIELGAGSTLAPHSAVLPDTKVGAHCLLGGRSVVLRGEELPAGTRWHGAPVVAA